MTPGSVPKLLNAANFGASGTVKTTITLVPIPSTTQANPNPSRVVTAHGPLPGALLIADRGDDRILIVDSQRHWLWHFPTPKDRKNGAHLVFDDDTFAEEVTVDGLLARGIYSVADEVVLQLEAQFITPAPTG